LGGLTLLVSKILKSWLVALPMLAVTACGVPQNSIEVTTAREAAAANCDETGKCVKDPAGLVLYNSELVTENFVLKRPDANQTLLTKLMNLIDEPKLLVTADKLEPLMRGVAIVGEFEPCDSPRGIDGVNPTAGQLRALKQGRYKACITYIGDGLFKRAYSLAAIDVDTTSPEVDNNGVAYSNLTPISANLTWSKAGDNLTLDGKLLYRIYTSTIQPMNSLDAVRLYGALSPGRVLGGTSYVLNGLSERKTYHAAVVIADEAGNESLVGSTTFQTPASDTQPPSLTISSIVQAITNVSPIPVTINFSESVTGFEGSDLVITGGILQGFSGANAEYTFAILPSSDGPVTINVAAGVATDSAGNGNVAATQFSVIYDSTAPLAAVISDESRTFNSSFATSIQQGVPVDANFKEFRYTLNGADPTCSTGTASSTQPTSVTIPTETTTLRVVACDQVGQVSPLRMVTFTYDNSNPTVAITSNRDPGPTNNSSILLTFTFSEAVTGFDAADVSVTNATKGTFTATSSTVYTLALTATGSSVTANVGANSATDTSGNGNLASTPWSITYDNSAPTVAITSNRDPGPTNNSSILLTFTFSEGVTGFDAADVTVNNATKGAFTSTSSTVYTLALTATGSAVTANVGANAANDTSGNGNTAAIQWSMTYDNSAPTVAITSDRDPGPTNNSAVTLTFTFSEGVTGFDATDVTVANATKGAFAATSSTVYTLAITPTASAVSASVAANSAIDSAANGNLASTPWSITYDNSAPTVAITSDRDPGPTNNSSILLTFTFSEGVTGFDAADVSVTNASKGTFTATSSTVYTLAITPTASAVSASVAANSAVDSAANGNLASTPWSITYDNSAPTVAITSERDPGPTNNASILLTFIFSEAVTGFDATDVTAANATKGSFTATSSTVYTLAITPTASAVSASVAANSAVDSAANGNLASTPWSITYDNSAPTVAITSDRDPGPTNNSSILLTFTFSEGVTGFDATDVIVANATKGTFTATSSTIYTLAITPTASIMSASVAASSAVDPAGNGNLASTPWSITYDNSPPTVAITSDRDPGPTNNPSITLTFTFSEAVTGFDAADVSVTNATKGAFTATSSTVYTLVITPTASSVSASVAANSAVDSASNGNLASTPWSITYDNSAPTVAITSNRDPGPTNNSAITLTFTFSEAVTDFDATDVTVNNASKGTFTATSATVYSLAITPTASAVSASVAANAATDASGNGNTAASQWSITYDNSAPTVAITSNRDPGPTNNAGITLTFTFSEGVTGFDATDVSVTNATKGAFSSTSSTVYTLALAPTGSAVSASLAANSAVDSAANGNLASTPWSITYDNSAPTVTITSNRDPGPTNNSPITLTFTFSEGVTGFDAGDVTVNNATKGAFTSTSSTVYTLAITPTGSAVSASVPGNTGSDLAGNGNTASLTWSITFDNTAPSLTALSISPVSPTNNQTPTVSFTLSEAATVRIFSDASCLTSISASTSKSSGAQTLTTNVLAEGTYGVYLVATDSASNSSSCTQVSTAYQISLTPPGAPINLAATPGDGAVNITWDPPSSSGSSSITDYLIRYSTNGGTTWTTFNDGVNAATGATVTALTNGTTYAFSVAAQNVAGTGSYSSNVTGIIPRGVPAAPTGVSGTAGDAMVSLTWTAPSNNGNAISDYVVQHSSDNGVTWTTFNDGTSATASAVVTGLTNGTAYKFKVAAVNVAGQGAHSTVSAAFTPSEALAPNVTGLTSTSISSSQINLSWTSGGSNTNQFQIAYKTGATAPTNCSSDMVILASAQGSATTAEVTGLTAGTQYSFRVCATNLSGALNTGATRLSVNTLAPEPSGLSAAGASSSSMALSWTSGGAGTNQFKIAYQTGASAPANCSSGTQVAPATVGSGTSYTVTGLTAGTQYSFRLCSTNTSGDLSGGITASGYPLAPNPASLTGLGASGTTISLNWSSGGAGTNQYQISYQSGATATASCTAGTVITAATQGSATSATITGLTQGTQYSFRVCSTNLGGELNTGGTTLAIYPLASAATNFIATAASGTSINLTWSAASGAVDYAIIRSTVSVPTSCSGGIIRTGTSTTITSLGSPYRHFFLICSSNGNGTYTIGPTAVGYTQPADPTGFTSTSVTANSVALSWSAGAASFSGNIYKVSYASGSTAPANCVAGNVVDASTNTSLTILGLNPATQYQFRVCAVTPNGDVNPGFSGVTLSRFTPPGAVSGLVAVGVSPQSGSGRIQLSWNSAAGATAYQISYNQGSTPPSTCEQGQVLNYLTVGNSTSYTVQGLALGGYTYSFLVCAYSSSPVSPWYALSTGASISSVPLEPDVINLSATALTYTNGFQLLWNLGLGGVSSYYKIAYQTGSLAPADCTSGTVISGSGTQASISSLLQGSQYSFRVCAMNGWDASAKPSAGVTVSAYPLPPAPTGFTVSSKTKTSISLSWASGGAGTNQYQIAYVQGASPPTDCISGNLISAATQGSATTRIISGLSIGTEYSFALCSTNGDGVFNLNPVTTYARTNYDDAPNASGLTAVGRSDSTFIDLAWTPPGTGMSGYKIAYQTGATAPVDCSTGTTVTLYGDNSDRVITGLTIGTQYAFRLCTLNQDYLPSSGITVSAYTRPPQPGALTVSSKTTSTVNLSWSSGGVGTSAYQIAYGLNGVRDFTSCTDGTVISPATQGSATTRSVTDLQAGTSYSFTVCAVNPDGVMNTGSYRYVTTSTNADTTAPTITSASVTTTSPGTTLTPSVSFTSNEAGTATLHSAAGCSTAAISSSSAMVVGSNSMTTNTLSANVSTSLWVKATDAFNNSSCTSVGTYIHDNTAPLAPVIADASKSFNATFSTSIQQGVPADANFKEFRYTTTGTDPTCSTGIISSSQPTSVSISAATATLKVISCDLVGLSSAVATSVYTYDITPPNGPTVTGTTPTGNVTPTWSWSSGGNGGNGTFRYKLNDTNLSTGATETTSTSFTPGSALSEATHTLYVQERDVAGNWSTSGSFAIQVVTPPAAPTLSTPTRNVGSLSLSWASVSGATSYNLYWSAVAGVTTSSTKISSVVSVHTHTPLTGGTTYYYKLVAVKSGIESALSNEVSASPYSYAAPTVTAISPNSGSISGGTSVTITGTGFVSGATVSIGGASATGVTFGSATSLTATTPARSSGAQNVVVTNPDGQTGTLSSGFTYLAAACAGDCYLEGSSPNFAQALAIGTERMGPAGSNLTLQFANGSSGFKIWREKDGSRILNASGLIANGWQATLARAGTGFSTDFTSTTYIGQIAGRVCPPNVFLDFTTMTASNRCLYYDSGNAAQSLNAATGTEATDWLMQWNRGATGRGVNSSYFEGNIKTCADKGMRLPVAYETTMIQPGSNLPTGDSITPTWALTAGVPVYTSYALTASASLAFMPDPSGYFRWTGTGNDVNGWSNTVAAVRCVIPNNAVASCAGDCYLEGTSPNFAQALAIGTERQGPSSSTLTLQFANGTSGYKVWREKNGTRILNAAGLVANGWQKQLARAGTSFSTTDFSGLTTIAGRACPPNTFLDFTNMTATSRCLYYDSGNGSQWYKLDSAGTAGVQATDWLQVSNAGATGRGSAYSYYEGNIQVCADKGMRLPVAYETSMGAPGGLPTGDSITPTWAANATNGVPTTANGYAHWTASAMSSSQYDFMVWATDGSNGFGYATWSNNWARVRCVLPDSRP
jgi:hypothetical protein